MTAAAVVPARDGIRSHQITTPEGVHLRFRVAPFAVRVCAFFIDVAFIVGIVLSVEWALRHVTSETWITHAISTVAPFAVFTLYFIVLESRSRASTYGKRMLGLAVINRRGGALDAEAVIVRNLVRNLETLAPLAFLVLTRIGGESGWVVLGSLAWLFGFSMIPFFSAARLRAGDLIAGTLVIEVPRARLGRDLAAPAGAEAPVASPASAFTDAELGVYGILELQTLELILRDARMGSNPAYLEAVATRIARRIGRQDFRDIAAARTFLFAYYAALRARLEGQMVLGHRKADRHSKTR